MQYFKLQIGCMLVILYIEITYNKEATRGKVPRNLFYNILYSDCRSSTGNSDSLSGSSFDSYFPYHSFAGYLCGF